MLEALGICSELLAWIRSYPIQPVRQNRIVEIVVREFVAIDSPCLHKKHCNDD